MKSRRILIIIAFILVAIVVSLIGFEPVIRTYFQRGKIARYKYQVTPLSDPEPSIKDLEARIKRDPTTALDRNALAGILISKAKRTGDETLYDQALALAQKSLELLPVPNPQARLIQAQIYSARHQFPKSIALIKEAMKEKNGNEGLALLATCYLATGELSEGLPIAEKLASDNPSLGSYSLLALFLQASGRNKEAEFYFQRGLEIEDVGETFESARVRVLFARFYQKFEKYSESDDLLKEAVHIMPGMPLALNQMGELELQRNRFDKAQKYFLDAFTTSRQTLYFHHYGIAKILGKDTENGNKVLKETEKLLRQEVSKTNYGHRAELATLLVETGGRENLIEARKLFLEELEIRNSSEILLAYLDCLAAGEAWKEGYPFLQKVLTLGPRDKKVYELASLYESKLGNTVRAQLYADLAKNVKNTL